MDIVFSLLTLTAMEIVLGIDNIVFIAILSARVPRPQQAAARRVGLLAALVTRLLLLLGLSWFMGLTAPLFHWSDLGVPAAWVQPDETAPRSHARPAPAAQLPADLPPGENVAEKTADKTVDEKTVDHGSHSASAAEAHDVDGVSVRDLILLIGGLFLIWHSVQEIHHRIEGEAAGGEAGQSLTFSAVIVRIALMDIIFSLDSVITAVGMAKHLWVMVVAVILAMLVMILFATSVSNFVERHPTIKMLALSFLILIGVLLVAEGLGTPVNKGYVYFAMAFSLGVEMLNLRVRAVSPVASDD